jgi:hypothetical protein
LVAGNHIPIVGGSAAFAPTAFQPAHSANRHDANRGDAGAGGMGSQKIKTIETVSLPERSGVFILPSGFAILIAGVELGCLFSQAW